jgi:hypothetical protein
VICGRSVGLGPLDRLLCGAGSACSALRKRNALKSQRFSLRRSNASWFVLKTPHPFPFFPQGKGGEGWGVRGEGRGRLAPVPPPGFLPCGLLAYPRRLRGGFFLFTWGQRPCSQPGFPSFTRAASVLPSVSGFAGPALGQGEGVAVPKARPSRFAGSAGELLAGLSCFRVAVLCLGCGFGAVDQAAGAGRCDVGKPNGRLSSCVRP